MNNATIIHDEPGPRYSIVMDGFEAYLTYERPRPGLRHITHTVVPEPLGGRGLGRKLVSQLMADIEAADERVSSACWFASGLIEKTPSWRVRRA